MGRRADVAISSGNGSCVRASIVTGYFEEVPVEDNVVCKVVLLKEVPKQTTQVGVVGSSLEMEAPAVAEVLHHLS